MEIDYDVTEQAIALLLPQFAEKKRVKGLLTGVLSPSDEVVSGINDITNGYDIDTAVGEQLTKLATLLNVKRNERTDDELRAAVKARIIINNIFVNNILRGINNHLYRCWVLFNNGESDIPKN